MSKRLGNTTFANGGTNAIFRKGGPVLSIGRGGGRRNSLPNGEQEGTQGGGRGGREGRSGREGRRGGGRGRGRGQRLSKSSLDKELAAYMEEDPNYLNSIKEELDNELDEYFDRGDQSSQKTSTSHDATSTSTSTTTTNKNNAPQSSSTTEKTTQKSEGNMEDEEYNGRGVDRCC